MVLASNCEIKKIEHVPCPVHDNMCRDSPGERDTHDNKNGKVSILVEGND